MFATTTVQTQKSTHWMNKVVSRFTQKAAPLPTLTQATAGRAIADSKYIGVCQVGIVVAFAELFVNR